MPSICVAERGSPGGQLSEVGTLVCVARWASSSRDHRAGDLCGRAATRMAGDVDLCEHHYQRTLTWRYYEKPLETTKKRTRALKEADADYADAVRASEIHRERVRSAISLVYYIRRTSDGMIKIGTTRSFARRMSTLRKDFGEIQVLLTHSGTAAEELAMHHKFEAYRAGRTEWFHPVKPLLRWVLETRQIVKHRETRRLCTVREGDLRKLVVSAPREIARGKRALVS